MILMQEQKMNKSCFFFFFFFIIMQGILEAQPSDYQERVNLYIREYREIAIQEMLMYRIPASITLAQGIHESNAGQSSLAKYANNHFGIKCHTDWFGKTLNHHDDAPNECFRKYDSPMESFRDHSYFLTQRTRYKGLFDLEITDYKGWAKGLQAAGYATNPKYAESLIRTIETFSLFQYDQPGSGQVISDNARDLDDPVANPWLRQFTLYAIGPSNRNVFANNELQMTIVRRDDNLSTLSHEFRISVKRLMRYNDLQSAADLKPGDIVYLGPKRRKGASPGHVVASGETLWQISQLHGIKLKMLYQRNHLTEGAVPYPGAVLKLR